MFVYDTIFKKMHEKFKHLIFFLPTCDDGSVIFLLYYSSVIFEVFKKRLFSLYLLLKM